MVSGADSANNAFPVYPNDIKFDLICKSGTKSALPLALAAPAVAAHVCKAEALAYAPA